ncbi:MAG: pteridine reductase [Legionella sp.]|nr:pteridine reductase [Legionella sp.]
MNRDKTQALGVALITGAARRIGAAIACALHDVGYDVVVHCHASRDDANTLATKLNTKRANSALVRTADLNVKSDAKKLIKAAFNWQQRLDVVVNNASNFMKTPVNGFDEAIWDDLWRVNVKAPFWLADAARGYLVQSNNANIINITDIHAEKPLRDYIVYAQTKAALKLQTEALAREYAPEIRVNAVAPGAIILPEGKNALSDETQEKLLKKIPLARFGAPKWVASAVLSVLFNAYMTGQTLRVDGGRTIS